MYVFHSIIFSGRVARDVELILVLTRIYELNGHCGTPCVFERSRNVLVFETHTSSTWRCLERLVENTYLT